MSEKIILDRKIGFQKTFYTKCINGTIDSIGPSIILRSILYTTCSCIPRIAGSILHSSSLDEERRDTVSTLL